MHLAPVMAKVATQGVVRVEKARDDINNSSNCIIKSRWDSII